MLKPGLVWERVNPLPIDKNVGCHENIGLAQMMDFIFDKIESIVKKGANPFLTMFF